ncbi:peptidase S8/S53 domain-containing protein [Lipomyces orientalis]|uniref:Peptidase S8/S53 domain-containing protein n=1 Tax=Lipomyces orientalis TaxID=1233043 RepID=A0ACC3TIE5_9ASCO
MHDDMIEGPFTTQSESFSKVSISPNSLVDRYIVVFDDAASSDQVMAHFLWLRNQIANRIGLATGADNKFSQTGILQRIASRFEIGNMRAYSGRFSRPLLRLIADRDEVAFIESDAVVTLYSSGTGRPMHQPLAPYNLARLSSRDKLERTNNYTYSYDPNPGLGVTVYVLDTGVKVSHTDFNGRAEIANVMPGSSDTDKLGHGTHVAATIAGHRYGVAKNATVVGVKVLSDAGLGTASVILRGIELAVARHLAAGGPSVINMSLGSGRSNIFNLAVAEASNQGMTVVVAAGNHRLNACWYSPASEPSAITVGASTVDDTVADFSNVGPCVDIFAPGKEIKSAGVASDSASAVFSGTSMAAPLVAGLAAYLLAKTPDATPAEIKTEMLELATMGALQNMPMSFPHTPNLIAFNGFE